MTDPRAVHETVGRHLILDGYPFVYDTAESQGSWIIDARDGQRYLDMFTMFASAPLGSNHPALRDERFLTDLIEASITKPANGDVYTTHLAEFVTVFQRVLGDPELPRMFLIEGGALAVENALKAAFDWKQQHNAANGRPEHLGTKVLHLRRAFHGRSGYTLSLTNTDPVKIARFPKFDWPRIDAPAIRFPLEQHLDEVLAAEERALAQAREAFERHGHDIACFIAEPIQGEGGDNHLRAEFLQAMEALAHEHDALSIIDEVQTGGGATGTPWCYQQLGLRPDLVAFGKKTQVCGVIGGRRLDEIPDNVFTVSSRINSTWGGNLVDIVRSRRIWEVVEADDLIPRAAKLGDRLLDRLHEVAGDHPGLVDNVRGRGLLAAFDVPTPAERDEFVRRLIDEERCIVLSTGETGVRFRPHLAVTEEDLDEATARVRRVAERLSTAP